MCKFDIYINKRLTQVLNSVKKNQQTFLLYIIHSQIALLVKICNESHLHEINFKGV